MVAADERTVVIGKYLIVVENHVNAMEKLLR